MQFEGYGWSGGGLLRLAMAAPARLDFDKEACGVISRQSWINTRPTEVQTARLSRSSGHPERGKGREGRNEGGLDDGDGVEHERVSPLPFIRRKRSEIPSLLHRAGIAFKLRETLEMGRFLRNAFTFQHRCIRN